MKPLLDLLAWLALTPPDQLPGDLNARLEDADDLRDAARERLGDDMHVGFEIAGAQWFINASDLTNAGDWDVQIGEVTALWVEEGECLVRATSRLGARRARTACSAATTSGERWLRG